MIDDRQRDRGACLPSEAMRPVCRSAENVLAAAAA